MLFTSTPGQAAAAAAADVVAARELPLHQARQRVLHRRQRELELLRARTSRSKPETARFFDMMVMQSCWGRGQGLRAGVSSGVREQWMGEGGADGRRRGCLRNQGSAGALDAAVHIAQAHVLERLHTVVHHLRPHKAHATKIRVGICGMRRAPMQTEMVASR